MFPNSNLHTAMSHDERARRDVIALVYHSAIAPISKADNRRVAPPAAHGTGTRKCCQRPGGPDCIIGALKRIGPPRRRVAARKVIKIDSLGHRPIGVVDLSSDLFIEAIEMSPVSLIIVSGRGDQNA